MTDLPEITHWRESEFPIRQAPPISSDRDIHIWSFDLGAWGKGAGAFFDTLSAEEQARADRFHFDRDRERFIAGRGLQRAILSAYLKSKPAAVEYAAGASGKLSIAGKNKSGLQFNFTRSGDRALLAVTVAREIGVDLEEVKETTALKLVAKDNFAIEERKNLDAIPAELALDGFYCCWTRKEAFVKATGDGLLLPLAHFVVSVDPRQAAVFTSINGDAAEAKAWSLAAFRPYPGHWAALAVKGEAPDMQFFALNAPK